jgi:hypothetical protein
MPYYPNTTITSKNNIEQNIVKQIDRYSFGLSFDVELFVEIDDSLKDGILFLKPGQDRDLYPDQEYGLYSFFYKICLLVRFSGTTKKYFLKLSCNSDTFQDMLLAIEAAKNAAAG